MGWGGVEEVSEWDGEGLKKMSEWDGGGVEEVSGKGRCGGK